jgi:hypothetical protein
VLEPFLLDLQPGARWIASGAEVPSIVEGGNRLAAVAETNEHRTLDAFDQPQDVCSWAPSDIPAR